MNIKNPYIEPYKSLQILDELSSNDSLTQRDLSDRLGIALGLVNSYIKNLAIKGFITIKAIPPKRYAYYLTPTGLAEKTRLAYDLLQDYTRIYREAKSNYRKLFHELRQSGVTSVLFAGADEVAEFAYITLQETGITLAGVLDTDKAGENFFGFTIEPLSSISRFTCSYIVITSHIKKDVIYKDIIGYGVEEKHIRGIF